MSLLELVGVSVDYRSHGSGAWRGGSMFRAVDDVTLSIAERETLALVGETGSGKSTLGRVATRLIRPASGEVRFMGNRIDELPSSKLRPMYANIGMIFQDPYASLNPRHRLAETIALPFKVHTSDSPRAVRSHVLSLLERVGLTPADRFARAFPHQLSGGQRQRVAIARAIALRPRLIVADEPVSSLDVSVAAQILNLLRDLQDELGMSYLLISHDLGMVRSFADRAAVMFRGKVVEQGTSGEVLLSAAHPYTQLLVSSIPEIMAASDAPPVAATLAALPTESTGCAFTARCPYAWNRCREEAPTLLEVIEKHVARCFLLEDAATAPRAWDEARRRLGEPAPARMTASQP